MLIYWLMYLLPVSMVIFVEKRGKSPLSPFLFLGFLFALLIGFRHEVGGDWPNYMRHYEQVMGLSFVEAVRQGKGDYGHQALNWLMAEWDLGVYGTNVIYGTVFIIGLVKFSRQQLYPWISMAVAVPYMVIVVAMGYSRQAMALGLFMWAITYLRKGKLFTYIVMIVIAALFHKTAIVLLPLGMFLYGKGKILRILMIVPLAIGGWDLLMADAQANLWYQYVDRELQSGGAKIRVAMNLLPAIVLLMYRKKWKREFDDYLFWFWIAIGSFISMALVGVASTAVDRMALYFIPIQLAVYGRLPYLMGSQLSPSVTKVLIVLMYTLVLFVWLNFGTFSGWWLPYQNLLWVGVF